MTSRARITLAIPTAATLLSLGLGLGLSLGLAPSALAEEKMGKSDTMMKQDTMSNASIKKDGKDAMSKDKMSNTMAKDAMKKDDMKKDDTKK